MDRVPVSALLVEHRGASVFESVYTIFIDVTRVLSAVVISSSGLIAKHQDVHSAMEGRPHWAATLHFEGLGGVGYSKQCLLPLAVSSGLISQSIVLYCYSIYCSDLEN